MAEAVVAGHVCLDIIPDLHNVHGFDPGRLIETGRATLATGGAVSNTGLALHRLGVGVRLVGKVGDDLFGHGIQSLMNGEGDGLGDQMTIAPGEQTSYTIVINLAGQDRMFLHSPGCNDTFTAADLAEEALRGARHLHFGYPPLMARMYADGGAELEAVFRKAKELGLSTSLDMSLPDADAPSGRADWGAILERVLPHVDVFLPSIEELLYMLDPEMFEQLRGGVLCHLPDSVYRRLAARAQALGTRMVGIKAGSRGLYVRVGSLEGFGAGRPADAASWAGFEAWAPCYGVKVEGTTGAGDATIAGFLMGMLRGMTLVEAARAGVAVGAFCCERTDAISGVRGWDETRRRIEAGWEMLDPHLSSGWDDVDGVFVRRTA